jgi:hypothetical protein
MEETSTAYEKSEEIVAPVDFEKNLKTVAELYHAQRISSGSQKVLLAGEFYRGYAKLVDSYTNIWEKVEK